MSDGITPPRVPEHLHPHIRSVVAEEVTSAIAPLLSHFDEIKTSVSETRAEIKVVKSCLETDVSGDPGVLERQRIVESRIVNLEESDKIRNRTVWGAVAAVGAAIFHTIWSVVTGHGGGN